MESKLFTAEQIKEIDRLTIEKQGISSLDLMERAVQNLLPGIINHLKPFQYVTIVAGVGNNGGDGLALARMLYERNFPVKVVVVPFSTKHTPEFAANLERIEDLGIEVSFDPLEAPLQGTLVDAIFGVGLNRPVKGVAARTIERINASGLNVLSIDIPSGLYADRNNEPGDIIVRATEVFTFQFPKISFFFDENIAYVPHWQTVDIGLDEEVIRQMPTQWYFLKSSDKIFYRRPPEADKTYFGHAVLMGGSALKSGAIRFAAQAAYRMGPGWTSAYVPRATATALRIATPEIMLRIDQAEDHLLHFPPPKAHEAYGVGPGMGTAEETCNALADWLARQSKPVVIDADALNCLARHPEALKKLPPQSILTPHRREWERLGGKQATTFERIQAAKKFSARYGVILVLKAHYTAIIDGQNVYFNTTGNPALAKAGTGDVLTGIITGLLAQGHPPLRAAQAGAFIHGLLADRWVKDHADFALTPMDLINQIALLKL